MSSVDDRGVWKPETMAVPAQRSIFITAQSRTLGRLIVVLLAAMSQIHDNGQASAAPGPPATPPKAVPVIGTCVDEAGKPLAGVKVALYRQEYKTKKHEKLSERETKADGGFEFLDAPALTDEVGLAVVVTKAGRGSIIQPLFHGLIEKPLTMRMSPAATLQGRVTDESGKPLAGARVWGRSLTTGEPIDGITTAVTDTDGKYAITDMGRRTDEDNKPRPVGNGMAVVTGSVRFDVDHPDFAREAPMWDRIPSTVDVVLYPGGVIAGQVTDRVTGKPAAGVKVSLHATQGQKELLLGGEARTGPDGKYEIRRVKTGKYNLWADAPDRTCVVIESLTVTAGKTLAGQDLTLVEGGWIEGRVLDAATGAPLVSTPGRLLRVVCHGPGRPKSGSAEYVAKVDEKGWFRMRVAPGRNYPYAYCFDSEAHREVRVDVEAGVEVKDGETTKLDFRITPPKPR